MTVTAFHWFVPLADPIPLLERAAIEVDLVALPAWDLEARLSLLPFQLEREGPTTKTLAVLVEALRQGTPITIRSASGLSFPAPVTVIEIAALIEREPDEIEISRMFSRGLAAIAEIQRAYYLATLDPVRIISLEQLPAFVPMIRREIDPDLDEQTWPDHFSLYLTHHGSIRAETMPEPLSLEQLQKWFYIAGEPDEVFWPYADLRRETVVAANINGDYRGAVLAAASAAEVLLDTALAHMLWVEGVTPEDASQSFSGPFVGRVRSQFSPRLGGSWTTLGAGPVALWEKNCAQLRHRVVHAGHRPSREETYHAIHVVHELEQFLAARLCTRGILRRNLRTALALVGIPGLERRGVLSNTIRREIEGLVQPQRIPFPAWHAGLTARRQ